MTQWVVLNGTNKSHIADWQAAIIQLLNYKKNFIVLTGKGFVQVIQQLSSQHSSGYFTHLTGHSDVPVFIDLYFQRPSMHMHCKIAFDQTSFNKDTRCSTGGAP